MHAHDQFICVTLGVLDVKHVKNYWAEVVIVKIAWNVVDWLKMMRSSKSRQSHGLFDFRFHHLGHEKSIFPILAFFNILSLIIWYFIFCVVRSKCNVLIPFNLLSILHPNYKPLSQVWRRVEDSRQKKSPHARLMVDRLNFT